MIIKHLVDRYNIYFVYTPSKISGRIHSTAITFFHIGILMMIFQVFTFCFMTTRNSLLTNVTMVALVLAALIFFGHVFFHCIYNINHLTYSVSFSLCPIPSKTQCKCDFRSNSLSSIPLVNCSSTIQERTQRILRLLLLASGSLRFKCKWYSPA